MSGASIDPSREDPPSAPTRVRTALLLLALAVLAAGVWVLVAAVSDGRGVPWIVSTLKSCEPISALWGQTIGNKVFYVGLVVAILLEWWIPAKKRQRFVSVGLCQDVLWYAVRVFFDIYLIAYWVALLRVLYDSSLSFLTIEYTATWPLALRAAVALLVADLIAWIVHWAKHRVSYFWYFHSVHHSQRELNVFTNHRTHFGESAIKHLIQFIPVFVLNISVPDAIALELIRYWHAMLTHGNIRTNLGPLRYVLVTPQSHRIHHSNEARHFHKNLGVHFTFWDWLFRTQYTGWDEYPDTGISDASFPNERSYQGILATQIRQLWYPFRKVAEHIRAGSASDLEMATR